MAFISVDLPRAGLPGNADDAAVGNGQRHAVDRVDGAVADAVADLEIVEADHETPRLLAKAALKPVEVRKRPRNSITVATMGATSQTILPGEQRVVVERPEDDRAQRRHLDLGEADHRQRRLGIDGEQHGVDEADHHIGRHIGEDFRGRMT